MTTKELRNNEDKNTTTVAIWKSTEAKLDRNKATSQSYNGFLCQLIDLWEKVPGSRRVLTLSSIDKR